MVSIHSNLSSANRDNFISFPTGSLLFPFFGLMAMAGTPSTMLNKSGES